LYLEAKMMVFGAKCSQLQYPCGFRADGISQRGDGTVISDTKIRQAKAKATAYQLTDERGLYLLVKPTGGKLWRWNYRHKGIQKTMSFGRYPDVPLAEARERLAAARRLLASGVD
jgi:hypothetical protein